MLALGAATAILFHAHRRKSAKRVSGTRAGRRHAARQTTALLLGAVFLGALLGAGAGERRRAACTASLVTGDSVVVSGIVTARGGGAGRGWLRLRLADVSLRGAAGLCRVPALLARVRSDGSPPEPGVRVDVAGEWRRFEDAGGGAWPPAPDRRGMLVGGPFRENSPTETAETDVGVERLSKAGRARPLLRARAAAAARLVGRLPSDVSPTALALLLAERDEIDPELRRRFVEAGLAHLLAISGMHVGILSLGVLWLLGFGLGPRRRMPVALALVTAYVVFIGAPPAARRAISIFAALTWARLRGWPTRGGELLGAALLAAILVSPAGLLDPGLQLSFAGFAGVVAGNRVGATVAGQGIVGRRLGSDPARRRFARRVWQATGAGVGALMATAPITALHFGQTTPVSVLSHFAGGPLVGVGLGSLSATMVLPGMLAGPTADVATGSIRALHLVVETFARLPGGHRAVPAPAAWMWIAWLLGLEAARRIVTRGRLRAALGPALFAGVALVAGPAVAVVIRGPALLCTLSVGQGDAAVFRTGGGRWMVFDGGPAWGDWNAGRTIVLPFLRRHGGDRIELAVLSHPDLDHLGGLTGLLPAATVERVLDSGDPVPSESYAEFLRMVDATGVQWIPAAAGDRFRVDGATLTVLGPVRSSSMRGSAGRTGRSGANATSLSFRLAIGRFRYLNTGDATRSEEAALLAAWPRDSLRANLLKIGHHGSRTSTSSAFLETVAPDLAVVSVGSRNLYGHPHPDVLARIRAAGVGRLWRTDRHGSLCVEVEPDGRWRVRGEGPWHDP